MCNKAVDNYPHALEFFSECFKTQKMCDIAVDTHCPTIKFASECCVTEQFIDAFSVLESIHGQYKT